jgi:hypothetical protein
MICILEQVLCTMTYTDNEEGYEIPKSLHIKSVMSKYFNLSSCVHVYRMQNDLTYTVNKHHLNCFMKYSKKVVPTGRNMGSYHSKYCSTTRSHTPRLLLLQFFNEFLLADQAHKAWVHSQCYRDCYCLQYHRLIHWMTYLHAAFTCKACSSRSLSCPSMVTWGLM